jgi:hypothetical protein
MLVAIISARANSKFTGIHARSRAVHPLHKPRHIQRYNPARSRFYCSALKRAKSSDAA